MRALTRNPLPPPSLRALTRNPLPPPSLRALTRNPLPPPSLRALTRNPLSIVKVLEIPGQARDDDRYIELKKGLLQNKIRIEICTKKIYQD